MHSSLTNTFGVRNGNQVFLDNQKKFYSEIFFPKLDEEGIKVVLDLGDTFDQRKQINFEVLYQAREMFFDEMQKRGIEYHSIVGNHTVTYKNTNRVNAIELLLQEYDNFHLYVNDPVELKFANTKFIMVPWLTSDNSERSLKILSKSKADVVCGHFDIQGYEMRRGTVSSHGLDKKTFEKFFAVYSGHYHHPNQAGNIEYLGAPYEMDWSDAGCSRGFHIFDCTSKRKEFIVNPYKLHVELDVDAEDMTEEDISDLDVSAIKGAFVRLNVTNSKSNSVLETLLEKMGGATSVVVADKSILKENGSFDIDEDSSMATVIEEYLKFAIGEDADEYEKVKTKITELYQEALTL